MKEFFKKKFIWIPALAVIVAGVVLVIVLTCSHGIGDADVQSPDGTVTQSQKENSSEDSDDSDGLKVGDGSDEIMTVDAGGDWN